jgi:hypothetical protein
MHMVGHQNVCMHEASMFRSRISKAVQVEAVIAGQKKRRLPIISPLDDVLRHARNA